MQDRADWIYKKGSKAYGALHAALGNDGPLPPYRVQFEITYKCDQDCPHCCKLNYYDPASEAKGKRMSADEWIALARSLPAHTLITITGGEPMIHPKFREILEGVASARHTNLLTHSAHMNDDIIDLIMRTRVILIGSALYGGPEAHDRFVAKEGAFERTVGNLRRLRERRDRLGRRRPIIDLKTVIEDHNAGSVDFLIEEAKRLKADYLTFSLAYDNPVMLTTHLRDDLDDPEFRRRHPWGPTAPESRRELSKVFERLVTMGRAGDTRFRFYPQFPNAEMTRDFFLSDDPNWPRLRTCRNPWGNFAVNPVGDVFPCLNYRCGNVKDGKPWKDAWRGREFTEFREVIDRDGTLPSCWGCCYIGVDFAKNGRTADYRLEP